MGVHHPLPNDIVDNPVVIAGIDTAFEAAISVRIVDANGNKIVEQPFTVGGTGTFKNYLVQVPLGGIPATPQGEIVIFEESAKDGSDVIHARVPVVFGTALLPGYVGFFIHTVVAGDTLSHLAHDFYGDAAKFQIIFDANRHILHNPNVIVVGQKLRIPQ